MIEVMKKFVEDEAGLSESDINQQFFKIRNEQDEIRAEDGYECKIGSDPKYFAKNRYRDIIPYDRNRIVLAKVETESSIPTEDEEEGYINASHIAIPNADAWYIAAQAPLAATLRDWFAMIREKNVRVIVMLCKLVELGKAKCERYWPEKVGEEVTFGGTAVTVCEEQPFEEFCKRKLKMRFSDGVEMETTQLHYSEWPDHGCPQSETHVLHMIELFDKLHYEDPKKPVLVHCSAGCGRTGTIIAANIIRELINSQKLEDELNLHRLVVELRKQRVSMVQTPDQYQFLHKLVAHFCREKLKSLGVEVAAPKKRVHSASDSYHISASESKAGSIGSPSTNSNVDSPDEILCDPSETVPAYPKEPSMEPVGPEPLPVPLCEQSAASG